MSLQDKLSSFLKTHSLIDNSVQVGFYLTAVVVILIQSRSHAGHREFFTDLKSEAETGNCEFEGYYNNKQNIDECMNTRQQRHGSTKIITIGDYSSSSFIQELTTMVGDNTVDKPALQPGNVVESHIEHMACNSLSECTAVLIRLSGKEPLPDLVIYKASQGIINKDKTRNIDSEELSESMSALLTPITDISSRTLFLWVPIDSTNDLDEQLQKSVKDLNTAIQQLLPVEVIYWSSFFSPVDKDLYKPSNIILNYFCNQCTSYWPVLSITIGVCCIMFWIGSYLIQTYYLSTVTDSDVVKKVNGILKGVTCVMNMSLIMAYFHMCDRESGRGIYKSQKEYSHLKFCIAISIILIVGVLFRKKTKDVIVLNRLQTEDWKGWMQLLILAYHFTGASKLLPIYFMVRLLVTAYLFLNGYGQFTFFFVKADFSLMRLTQTFLRLNFLVVLLCIVMDRSYQFYYFVPLVSFWFVVIYLTMALWPRINASQAEGCDSPKRVYQYLLAKLVILAICVTVLASCTGLSDAVFKNSIVSPLFLLDNSVHEWRFRWGLDRYSVLAGMMFALAYQYLSRSGSLRENEDTVLFTGKKYAILSVLSCLFFTFHLAFAFLCRDKYQCNRFYPYIGILPVLGYVLLRNMHHSIRSSYSPVYAWFGKISLELFIAQYHIWLSDDTRKTLVLIPQYSILNFILITFIFVSVCCEIQRITSFLASYFIAPKSTKPTILPKDKPNIPDVEK